MDVTESKTLPGLLFVESPTHDDERGFFREYFRQKELACILGSETRFVQANHSHSRHRVLRGIHCAAYAKYVYVPVGDVLCAFVDLRPTSAQFGKHEMVRIGDSHRVGIFLPPGIGNAYYVESAEAHYLYFVGTYYDPALEQTIVWNDPDLAIPWPDHAPIISNRDARAGRWLEQVFPPSPHLPHPS